MEKIDATIIEYRYSIILSSFTSVNFLFLFPLLYYINIEQQFTITI